MSPLSAQALVSREAALQFRVPWACVPGSLLGAVRSFQVLLLEVFAHKHKSTGKQKE